MLPDAVRVALGGPAELPPSSTAPLAAARRSSQGGGGGGGSSRPSSSGGGEAAAPAAKVQSPLDLPDVMELPRASEVLATMRRRIEALNGPGAPRI
jgi:hypothetical protein